MARRPIPSDGRPTGILALLFACVVALSLGWASPSRAVPAFAQQTGERCSACHVGAFGPQLKPYGRDFKLYGYVSGDNRNTLPPIALLATLSFTHTNADQASPPDHFRANDNIALDEANLIYGGRLVGGAGAFIELTYDGVDRRLALDNVDIKRTFDLEAGEHSLQLALDLNNSPTVQDLWNTTPVWRFPNMSSHVAPTPSNATLLEDALATRVTGLGVSAMGDSTLYTELTLYRAEDPRTLERLGQGAEPGSDVYDGIMPYWRLALQHQFGGHYVEIGGYGLSARRFPGGDSTAGADRISDTALDATYQYTGGGAHYVSAHASWIHETDRLDASRVLDGSRPSDHLDTAQLDLTYSYADTWTPTVELFRTRGSNDPAFFADTGGTPNSSGYTVELAYAPWGKEASPVPWANARFVLQYVGYRSFNGSSQGASANNTLFLAVRVALAPFGAGVKR